MADPIVMPSLRSAEQRAHAQALLNTAYQTGITDPKVLANFMGQMQHESQNFSQFEEGLRYRTEGGINKLYKNYPGRNGLTNERALEIASLPDPLERDFSTAEQIYGGAWGERKLGNSEPGDGYRYRGRGYTQLTGRYNYSKVGEQIGVDLEANPDLAAQPEVASRIAVAFWQRKVDDFAQRKSMPDVTGSVLKAGALLNGSFDPESGQFNEPKGYPDRLQNAQAWASALKPEHLQALNKGEPVQLAAKAPSPQATLDPTQRRLYALAEQTLQPRLGGIDVNAPAVQQLCTGIALSLDDLRAARGEVCALYLSKDGQRLAAVHGSGQMSEFSLQAAAQRADRGDEQVQRQPAAVAAERSATDAPMPGPVPVPVPVRY